MGSTDKIVASVITSGEPNRQENGIKQIAINLGKVSGQKFGKLNVFIYGGNIQAQTAVVRQIKLFFNQTLHGAEILKVLELNKNFFGSGVKPLDVIITSPSFRCYDINSDVILVFRKPPEIKNEDNSKGNLKSYKTTITDGDTTSTRTTIQGSGGDASLKGMSFYAGKNTEYEVSRNTFYGLVVITTSSRIGYADLKVDGGRDKFSLKVDASAKGSNYACGGKIHINLFGGFDLITVNADIGSGIQIGANCGYSKAKGLGVGAELGLGPAASFNIGILNFYKKSMSCDQETIEGRKAIGRKQ
jgi:hypothetical protein